MNAAEDRLSELMDAATRALAPPVESILAEGERLGRRRRRRRRAAVVTSTAAAVLLAGAGTVAGVRFAHVDHDRSTPVAGSGSNASRAPTATPAPPTKTTRATPSPSPSTDPTDVMEPINSQVAVDILKMNGGAGWKFAQYAPDNYTPTSLLDVDVDDGLGTARIFIAIGPTANSGMDPADCAGQSILLKKAGKTTDSSPLSCNVRTYANGDRVMQEVLRSNSSGEYQFRIIAYRADGVALEITAANGDGQDPKQQVTRALPPLSMAQWTAIALNKMWQLDVSLTVAQMTPSP